MRGVVSPLPTRAVVSLLGQDSQAFLQSLFTSDLVKQPVGTVRVSTWLTPKGRVAHDVFLIGKISKDEWVLECGGGGVDSLVASLKRVVLRRKVQVERFEGWTGASTVASSTSSKDSVVSRDRLEFMDPRPGLETVTRVWSPAQQTAEWMKERVREGFEEEKDDRVLAALRMASGIPEGAEEIKQETPFAMSLDLWPGGAIAYDKGCYTGQELVARTHFKGTVRTRLVPVILGDVEGAPNASHPHHAHRDALLPRFVDWVANNVPGSQIPVGARLEPIPNAHVGTTPVADDALGEIVAVAPFRKDLALATVRHAADVVKPGFGGAKGHFEPTHMVVSPDAPGTLAFAHLIRPAWWP